MTDQKQSRAKQAAKEIAAPPEEDQPLDAVIIVKELVDGETRTKVVVNGSVQITEVETLLKLGLKGFQAEMGLT